MATKTALNFSVPTTEIYTLLNWPITVCTLLSNSHPVLVNLYVCHKLLLSSFSDSTGFKFLIFKLVFLVDQSLSSLLDHLRINSSTDIGSMIISDAGQGNLEKLKELLHVHPDKVWYKFQTAQPVRMGLGKPGNHRIL